MPMFEFVWKHHGANDVKLAGSFNDWQPQQMNRNGDGWNLQLDLNPGLYQFKFVVDGNWVHDDSSDTMVNEMGSLNNCVTVIKEEKVEELPKENGNHVPMKIKQEPVDVDESEEHQNGIEVEPIKIKQEPIDGIDEKSQNGIEIIQPSNIKQEPIDVDENEDPQIVGEISEPVKVNEEPIDVNDETSKLPIPIDSIKSEPVDESSGATVTQECLSNIKQEPQEIPEVTSELVGEYERKSEECIADIKQEPQENEESKSEPVKRDPIEVERKFIIPKNFSALLGSKGFEFKNRQVLNDKYFDRNFELLSNDFWLRKRNHIWELKYPAEDRHEGNSTQYRECSDEVQIIKMINNKFGLGIESLENDLEMFAELDTERETFARDVVNVVVDTTSWGCRIAEVEVVLNDEDSSTFDAVVMIDHVALELDILNNATKYGKIDSYLEKFNQKGYAILHKCDAKTDEEDDIEVEQDESVEIKQDENVEVKQVENVEVKKDENVEDKDDSIEVIKDENVEVNKDDSIEVIDESESESVDQSSDSEMQTKNEVKSGENAEMKHANAKVNDSKSENEDDRDQSGGEARYEADDEVENDADENEPSDEMEDEDFSDDEPPNVHSISSSSSTGPAIGFRCSIL